ncbi:MAG: Maf family protein [Myxococcota bacterium]
MSFTLASASPRRRALLEQLGLRFAGQSVDIDETPRDGEDPERYVQRMAAEKLAAAQARFAGALLSADTTVTFDGTILGKPASSGENASMLRRLAGRTHRVITAVAVFGEMSASVAVQTEVTFGELSDARINGYVRTGEGQDKAGGYAIQGLGAGFVRAIDGSYSNVVGLPLYETLGLLEQTGAVPRWP